jgi:hypothetical protein
MGRQRLSYEFAGVDQELGHAPSPAMREVLLRTENSVVATWRGQVIFPWVDQLGRIQIMGRCAKM